MTWLRIAPLIALATLAACASSQQRCVNAATRDLRTIDTLITEINTNLQRGYALERETEVRSTLTFCTGRSAFYGYGYGGMSFCTAPDVVQRTRPVAIDPAEERRKLANLRERRAAVEVTSRQAIAACGI